MSAGDLGDKPINRPGGPGRHGPTLPPRPALSHHRGTRPRVIHGDVIRVSALKQAAQSCRDGGGGVASPPPLPRGESVRGGGIDLCHKPVRSFVMQKQSRQDARPGGSRGGAAAVRGVLRGPPAGSGVRARASAGQAMGTSPETPWSLRGRRPLSPAAMGVTGKSPLVVQTTVQLECCKTNGQSAGA